MHTAELEYTMIIPTKIIADESTHKNKVLSAFTNAEMRGTVP